QDQGDPYVQQPPHRIAGRGPYPRLMQLPVGGLDGEPPAIRLSHPVERWGHQPPEGIDQPLLALPAPLATVIPAFDADRDPRRPLASIVQGVGAKAALLPGQEHVGPAGPPRIVELAASADHRHQKWLAGRLEITDHSHAVEAAVQEQQAAADADRTGLVQQALEDLFQRLPPGGPPPRPPEA